MLVARRRLLRQAVALADIATLDASFLVAYAIVGYGLHRNFSPLRSYAWLLEAIIPIWLVSLWGFGLYRSAAYCSTRRLLIRLIQAHLFASLVLFSLMYMTRSEVVSRLLLESFVTVSLAFLSMQKFALMVHIDNTRRQVDCRRRKVVLVADLSTAERYLSWMRTSVSVLADVVKVLIPNGFEGGSRVVAEMRSLLGSVDDLPGLIDAQVIDEVIAPSQLDPSVLERLSRWCSVRGTLLHIWFELPCPAVGSWTAEFFGEGAFLLSLAAVPRNPIDLAVKRLVDVIGAAVGMILCSIVYVWCGHRLRRETGGSVLFRQLRVGKNGRPFVLYKFRTMGLNAEESKASLMSINDMRGPMFKIRNDPRITPTGRKLRERHLDELPQCWNVLRGEMSLVGTRPPTGVETAAYVDYHRRRLSMKPGITGLWQLNGNGAVQDFEKVVKLDCHYIDNWSLWLDAKILARTINKVMRGEGW